MYAVTTKGKTVWIEKTLNGGAEGSILVDTDGKHYRATTGSIQIVEIEVSAEDAEALEVGSAADLGDEGVQALAEGVEGKIEDETLGLETATEETEAIAGWPLAEPEPLEEETPADDGAAAGSVDSGEEGQATD